MLIATLPPVHQRVLLVKMIRHPLIGAVRYNTGVDSAYSPKETLEQVLDLTTTHKKSLYIDLKGRQIRISAWATFPEGPIILNHRIRVKGPARVGFRGDDTCDLVEIVDGNIIYTDPYPRYPVGRGQSINILADEVILEENFIDRDRAYIEAAADLGLTNFMLSFVEDLAYVQEFEDLLADAGGRCDNLVLKIESAKGVELIRRTKRSRLTRYQLMAARDDLMIQIGAMNMLNALRDIAKKDPKAICASRLLMGLEDGSVSMADISDLSLMRSFGYRHFMLSDGISRNHFDEAMRFWQEYSERFGNKVRL